MKRFVVLPLCFSVAAAWGADEKMLKAVTVSAAGENDVAERRESATQKVIVTRTDIENMGALTISDVMGKLPGVDAGTPGADGSMAMRSRGMVRDSVMILIDGERVGGGSRMAQAVVGRLPSTELARVEIMRGSSAEVGGNAPLTINLVLNKPISRDSTSLKLATGVRGDLPQVQTSFSKGGGDKTFTWLLPVTLNFHNMPSHRLTGRMDSTGVNQRDDDESERQMREFVFSPRLSWKSGADSLTLSPSIFRARGSSSGDFSRDDLALPLNSLVRDDDENSRTGFNRFRADGEILRQGVKYSARVAFSDGERKSDTRRESLTAGGVSSLSREHSRRDEQDLNSAFRIDWAAGSHVLATAVEQTGHWREESQRNSGLGANEKHDAWDRQWSLWVQDEWTPVSNLTITGGVRGETFEYAVDGDGQNHHRLLPSIAVRWEPVQRWVMRSSLGAGVKPPRLDEITNQPVFSVNANTPIEPDRRGNPDLQPERSVNLEAALEHYLPDEAGVIGINAYLRRTENFTERRVMLEGARWVDRPYNEGQARHWGVELDGKLRTDKLGWRGATLRAHLTVPRSKVDDERLGITRAARDTPRYILSAGFDQTMAEMSFGASMQYNGRVLTRVPGEQSYETRRRVVFDAYALQKLTPALNLRLSLQNILGADTRRQYEAFAPGSSWLLSTEERMARTILLSLEGKW